MIDIAVKFSVDGKTETALDNIMKIVVLKSDDTPCDYMECVIHENVFLDNIKYLNMYINGTSFFNGIVDKRVHKSSSDGNITTIYARRGIAALLVDNEAMPRVYSYPKMSLVASIHAYQYGIKGIDVPSDRGLPYFTVIKGISEWDAISLFTRQVYNVQPYINDNNYIVAKPRIVDSSITLSNVQDGCVPYAYAKITDIPYKRISHVYICKDDGTYTMVNNKGSGTTRRRQFYVPSSQWTLFPRWSVNEIIKNSMDNSFSVEVQVPEYINIDLGTGVLLEECCEDVSELILKRIKYDFAGRITTTLTLGKGVW